MYKYSKTQARLSLALGALLALGCSDDDDDDGVHGSTVDAGRSDAGSSDGGTRDAARSDADDDEPDADDDDDRDAGEFEPGTAEYSLSLLDDDMRAVIDELTGLGGKPIETLTPEEARVQPTVADAVGALLTKRGESTGPEAVASVEDTTIPGPAGTTLPIRIYKPSEAADLPLIVYYHGGGWVIATIDTYDASARALSNAADAIVVSVEYRKGPENKFPAAHDDAYAAYTWALENAASLGADGSRIAVAGESAGGNLAATVALAARDNDVQAPVHALLVYPVASADLEAPSYIEHAQAKPLNAAMIPWFTGHYFRTPADGTDPRISLVDADLSGLPPTTIINAEVDPLRSDGDKLTDALDAANVDVVHKLYEGVTHEFFGTGAVVADAKDAVKFGAERLKSNF